MSASIAATYHPIEITNFETLSHLSLWLHKKHLSNGFCSEFWWVLSIKGSDGFHKPKRERCCFESLLMLNCWGVTEEKYTEMVWSVLDIWLNDRHPSFCSENRLIQIMPTDVLFFRSLETGLHVSVRVRVGDKSFDFHKVSDEFKRMISAIVLNIVTSPQINLISNQINLQKRILNHIEEHFLCSFDSAVNYWISVWLLFLSTALLSYANSWTIHARV